MRASRCEARLGLIPAHAGSTGTVDATTEHRTAHPRSRGEHGPQMTWLEIFVGSSPLTRGALVDVLVVYLQTRLIPAHAGSTPRLRL